MGLVSLFATSLVAPAAKPKSALIGLVLKKEKSGPATARMKPLLYPRDHASLTIPVPCLLGHLTKLPVPVVRRM